MFFLRPPVATLRLKIVQITCPAFHVHDMLSIFALLKWLKCHKEETGMTFEKFHQGTPL